MRSQSDIHSQVSTRYRNKWRSWLSEPPTGGISFPLEKPTADELADPDKPAEIETWKLGWTTWARQRKGISLRTVSVRTAYGRQDVPTHVDFDDVTALASLDEKAARHWALAQQRSRQVLADSGSPKAVRRHLARIVDLDDADFNLLLAAAAWFRLNPRSGLLPRQVPVESMHTKWLARHRSLVLGLLGIDSNPSGDDSGENSDPDLDQEALDPLGLVAPPPLIDLILADANLRTMVGGIRHLRAPVQEIARLQITPRIVLIVENKESALIVPDFPGLLIIHSLGNHLNAITELPWLREAQILYWGDLDRWGMTLLSRARSFISRTRSVLMGPDVVAAYKHLAVRENLTRVDPPQPTLTPPEVESLRLLTDGHPDDGHLQLEQERLPESFVLEALRPVLTAGFTNAT